MSEPVSPAAQSVSSRSFGARDLIAGLLVAAASAGAWLAWMGWDDEYQVDAAGNASGPYEVWQVVGCALTLIVLAVLAAWLWRPWAVVVIAPIAFTLAWSVTAARSDDSGLWAVGAIMVLVGTVVGAIVCAIPGLVRQGRRP